MRQKRISSGYRTLALTLLFVCPCGSLQAQTLEGHVSLGEAGPATFATIYVPSTGQGAVTDAEGRYLLENMPEGKVEVEFSYMGYSTVKRVLTFDEAKTYSHDESLTEQAIVLKDVYVTPTGEDPALFILRKVAERGAEDRKHLIRYEAQEDYVFHAQDLDFLPAILPKPVMWILNSAAKVKHRGAIFEFCCNQERVDARLTSHMTYDHGKFTYYDKKLLSATPALPDKERDQMFVMARKDPFEKLYGDNTDYGMKKLKKGKCKYQLKGTIEENGQVIDILVNEQAGDSDDPGVMTLYVIEDNWSILRSEFIGKMSHERIECRKVGKDIYLPISYLNEPTFEALNLDQEMERFKSEQAAKGEKIGSMGRKYLDRMERYKQKQSKPSPSIAIGYSINYNKLLLDN